MTVTLQKFRGALALVGQEVNDLAASALVAQSLTSFNPIDPNSYHITVATKDELRTLSPEQIAAIDLDTRHLTQLGVGGKPRAGVYWVVVIWAAGQQLRKKLGLPPKHFHITLSTTDLHDIDKDISSLLAPPVPQSYETLDHIILTFQSFGQWSYAKNYASTFVQQVTTSHKGFLRLGDAAFSEKTFKLAMLSYACAYDRATDTKVQSYCLKKITESSQQTEWAHLFQDHEIAQLDDVKELSTLLLAPWSQDLRETLSERNIHPTLCLETRQSLHIPSPTKSSAFYQLPRFFRWLIPNHLAIMSTPRNEDDIVAFASSHLGIRHVLTLTEETPLPPSWFQGKNITNTFLPIPNFQPPSIEQMDFIMRLFSDSANLPLLVHCGGGKGRAGTVAACYLAACGFGKPSHLQDHPEMSAAEAISALRAIRPGSLETSQQETFVSSWCSTIWKRQSIYPKLPTEPPPCPMEIEGTLPGDVDLLILVGLPGSGKSWFSKSLLARDPQRWIRISQDDAGSRASCETEIGRPPKPGKSVILDRCNTSSEDRKRWLALASTWCLSPVCVYFDYDATLCTARAQMRAGHPTLPPGGRVRSAVEQMQRVFVRQKLQEDGIKAIVVVRSFEAAQQTVLRLSPPVAICKFPRTPHLIDVGAATEDDLHGDLAAFAKLSLTSSSAQTQPSPADTHVIITEKVDGANMGFSLSFDRTRILVQNRSHHINPSTHEQFKKLGGWVASHEAGLRHILDRDPYFADRYILYGEWVYATHSIAYTQLPDWFIAYDLYDRSTKTFADTRLLWTLLDGTGICMVPKMYVERAMPNKEELLGMIQRKSVFYDGRVEGVYVKVETRGSVRLRGKVVRSDFIAGNDHWTRGGIRVNGLQVDNS